MSHEPVIIWGRHLVTTLIGVLLIGYSSVLASFYNHSTLLSSTELARSAFYNIPALLVVGLPLGVGFATLTIFTNYGSLLPERARLAIFILCLALSILSFYLANEVVPQANRSIPLVFELYRTPGLLFEDTRRRRRQEMTTWELATVIRDMQERGLNTRSYQLTYHLRFALPALTFCWGLCGICLGYFLARTFGGSSYLICTGISLAIIGAMCLATYFFWAAARSPLGLSPFWVAWLPGLASLFIGSIFYLFFRFEEELIT